jgi:hypothetical protein
MNMSENNENLMTENGQVIKEMKNKKLNSMPIWGVLSGLSFLISCIMIYLGFNKMTQYDSVLHKNSYVGGDAYNYIINGTYATSFFVLALVFSILGIGFIIVSYLDKISANQ